MNPPNKQLTKYHFLDSEFAYSDHLPQWLWRRLLGCRRNMEFERRKIPWCRNHRVRSVCRFLHLHFSPVDRLHVRNHKAQAWAFRYHYERGWCAAVDGRRRNGLALLDRLFSGTWLRECGDRENCEWNI